MSPTYSVTRLFSQTFTSSGTFVVPPFTYSLMVLGCGGGAGGSGSHYSGNGVTRNEFGGKGASVFSQIVSVSPFESISVTIGAGGAAGVGNVTFGAGTAGGAGGDSLFGSYITFPGAPAGPYHVQATASSALDTAAGQRGLTSAGLQAGANGGLRGYSNGGTSTNAVAGQNSGYASGGSAGSGSIPAPGGGGGASYGAGGAGANSGGSGTSAAANTGGGGGGPSVDNTSSNGGAGGSGIIIVYWNSIRAP